MGSTFGGIEISKRGLVSHQTALNTTGHNISNADNENYSRQRVSLESMTPLYQPSLNRAAVKGQLGQGGRVVAIERIRDLFYDDQIIHAEGRQNYWNAKSSYLIQMEQVFNEPSDNTLRSLMDRFWSSFQELANFPSDAAHRKVVLERGNALVARIQDTQSNLQLLRRRANMEIAVDIEKVNSLAFQIRELNERILKLQALGDHPNDLLDRRDAALEKLSQLANIHLGRGDKDELIVFIGEQMLIQGEIQNRLIAKEDPLNNGMFQAVWENNQKKVVIDGGHIHGLLEVRDKLILERIDQVDTYALHAADIVNEAHRDGFGLNGKTNLDFFQIRPLSPNADGRTVQNARGDYDLNQDGTSEVTALFRITGTNVVDPDRRIGIQGTLRFFRNDRENTEVFVEYREDDTLKDVVQRINEANAGIVSYINHDNQLAIKAVRVENGDRRTNFMIRHLEDSGDLLTGYTGILFSSGAQGAFDFRRTGEISKIRSALEDITLTPIFHPSSHIRVSDNILRNPASIAAGRGKDINGTGDYNTANGSLDGANALIIAAGLKQAKRMIGNEVNPEEFYNSLIAKLGTESRTAEDAVQRFKDDILELNRFRQSVMGVSLDEEMSNMVQFQHAYNASAKMIQTQNEILDVIVNQLGA